MFIETLSVDEGFLENQSIEFVPGLNVLIGPRGSGKTSVLELIRFALGVKGYSDALAETGEVHAASVIGEGTVRLRVIDGAARAEYARSRGDDMPQVSGERPLRLPIVLSQSEIETIGTLASSRLRLLDDFRPEREDEGALEQASSSLVRSLTIEIAGTKDELAELRARIASLEGVPSALETAKADQAAALESVDEAAENRSRLERTDRALAALAARSDHYSRSSAALASFVSELSRTVALAPTFEPWPPGAGDQDQLAEIRNVLSQAVARVMSGLEETRRAESLLDQVIERDRDARAQLEHQARPLRSELDALVEGAGAAAKRITELEAQAGQLTALRERERSTSARLADLQGRRSAALDELNEIRAKRSAEREEISQGLSERLRPKIRVDVARFGNVSSYANTITAALRGSGLHLGTLAAVLASSVSPLELAEYAELGDAKGLSETAGIPADRAARVLGALSERGVESILTTPVEDSVDLLLLDGSTWKDTEEMSMGQRCTVTLPVLLSHDDRVLAIDQPEDNLDNAFIVDTVVRGLRERRGEQVIVATHNPNIPVLGEAARVFVMGSDGKRGFVRNAGNLDDPVIVTAITNVMEGGREAFERRAEFYRANRGST